MSGLNQSTVFSIATALPSAEFSNKVVFDLSPFESGNVLAQLLSFTTLWRLFVVVFLLVNLKCLPLIWHLRIVNAFRFCMRTQRPKVPITPAHLFQPLITSSHAPLMEIDLNMHKTNSSYFSDVDIARTHLFCTLFSKGMEHKRGGTGAINRSKEPMFGISLGAVSCSFKKELKPYERYEMWTRVLSWDQKWIYVVTHFVREGAAIPQEYTLYPQQTSSRDSSRRSSRSSSIDATNESEKRSPPPFIYGTALSRCVFKQGRKTIAPELMMRLSGLLPGDYVGFSPETAAGPRVSAMADETVSLSVNAEEIEAERKRGMEIASQLATANQQDLEESFTGNGEALGMHTDGAGIVGVVSTLAQLARLKKDQIL